MGSWEHAFGQSHRNEVLLNAIPTLCSILWHRKINRTVVTVNVQALKWLGLLKMGSQWESKLDSKRNAEFENNEWHNIAPNEQHSIGHHITASTAQHNKAQQSTTKQNKTKQSKNKPRQDKTKQKQQKKAHQRIKKNFFSMDTSGSTLCVHTFSHCCSLRWNCSRK